MRFTTLASIGVLALSTAALAQVAGTPVEQKVPAAGTNTTDEMLDNAAADMPANSTASAAAATMPANDMAPAGRSGRPDGIPPKQ